MGGRLLSIEHDQVGREGAQGVGLGSLEGDLTRVKNVQPSSSNSTSKFHKANGCKLQVMMCMPLVTCTKKTAKLNFRVESNYDCGAHQQAIRSESWTVITPTFLHLVTTVPVGIKMSTPHSIK